MTDGKTPAGTIFISYRREDTSGHAGRLYDRLSAHFGDSRIFMDIDTIKPGVDFVTVINEAVASCAVLLALIGHEWLTVQDRSGGRRLDDPKDFNRLEIEAGLREATTVIPVLVQGATMPRTEELPGAMSVLARRNAIELSDARWDYDVQRLIAAIEEVVGKPAAKPKPSRKLLPWLVAGAAVLVVAIGAALLLSGGGTPECGGKATNSLANSEIAFLSDRDNNEEIYGVGAGGIRVTRFTNDGVDELRPDWSHDGGRLAFGTGSGNHALCIMNTDGSGARLIRKVAGDEEAPDWSPDDSKIAFSSGSKFHSNIFIMNSDGSGSVTKLTDDSNANGQPDWSINDRIAFSTNAAGGFDIFVMNTDRTGRKRLTQGPGNDGAPAWSPDGNQIAFRRREAGLSHIFMINADGNGLQQVTHGQVSDSSPTWAPSGKTIAFSRSEPGHKVEIYVLDLGQGSPEQFTRNTGNNIDPAWRP